MDVYLGPFRHEAKCEIAGMPSLHAPLTVVAKAVK